MQVSSNVGREIGQNETQSPSIVTGSIQPQKYLPEYRRIKPGQKEDQQQEEDVPTLVFSPHETIKEENDQAKNKGVKERENRLWQKQKQVGKKVSGHAPIHGVPVHLQRLNNIRKGLDTAPIGIAERIGVIIGQHGGQGGQYQNEGKKKEKYPAYPFFVKGNLSASHG